MKTLSKIILRYLISALIMLLLTLVLNVALYVVLGFRMVQDTNRSVAHIRLAAEQFFENDEGFFLSEEGYAYLEEHYVWAMMLDDDGAVIWDWKLPPALDHPYTAREIAVFSKWYLDDYPVTERITDYGLLVAAQERGTIWKMNISDSPKMLEFIVRMIPITLIVNLGLLILIVFFLGIRFYGSLRTLEQGIRNLSEQTPIRLPEKGMTALLAKQLNKTSELLIRQREKLNQRDDARTAWISGVSHDIRTPLSLIMGYASDLKEDPALPKEQRRLAGIIRQQSLKIRQLIEDLNLTSRLAYHMQPLRMTDVRPSGLLRTVVSSFYNQGLSDSHIINLHIDPGVEQLTLQGDLSLLNRAFSNLIGNSIRHNPEGCTVTVTAYPGEENGEVCFQVSDDGRGIPGEVIDALASGLPDTEKAPHIMGLRIVRQIFLAHGWEMIFTDANTIHILGKDREHL